MTNDLKIAIASIAGSLLLGGIIYYAISKNGEAKGITSILFVGDSNTAANFSYADQLKKQFPTLKIKKIAQNGANTTWMKQQLTTDLKNNKYDVVCILGGSNDIYGGLKLDTTKANLNAMYDLAHNTGAKVIAITPPNKDFYTLKTADKQKLLSDLVSWIQSNPKRDYFINFYALTNNKALFTPADNYLHPQAPAHKTLAEKVTSSLKLKA